MADTIESIEDGFKALPGELGGDPLSSTPAEVTDDGTNIYTVITGEGGKRLALEATDDQIIVVEDKFRTGFECKTCDGEQHTGKNCEWCKGTGVEPDSDTPRGCRFCANKIIGKQVCPDCKGTGGLLIAPDVAKRRPTTGVVTSIGPLVHEKGTLKVGTRVLYSLFAGSAIQFKQSVCVRIMHQHEVMCILHGAMKIGDNVK